MKKLLLAVTTLLSVAAWAQTPNLDYTRNSDNGSTSPSGTYLDYDDEIFPADTVYKNVPIGFTFLFNGEQHQTIDVSANGKILLGNNGSAGEIHIMAANLIDRGTFDPLSNSTISYKNTFNTTENANVLQVFWTGVGFDEQTSDSTFMTVTIELVEGKHSINLYYGNSKISNAIWSQVTVRPTGGIFYNDGSGTLTFYCFNQDPFMKTATMSNGVGTPPDFQFGTGSGIKHSFSSVYAGVKEVKPSSLRAYPNPAIGTLKVEADGFSNSAAVTMTDLAGKVVLSTDLSNASSIPVEGLAKGIYMLTVTDNGKTATQKVTVQ